MGSRQKPSHREFLFASLSQRSKILFDNLLDRQVVHRIVLVAEHVPNSLSGQPSGETLSPQLLSHR
jgi:hypothetical protein